MIIDAWMQHFDDSQLTHPMFASLRRWTRQSFAPVTPEMTMAAMDEGRVSMGLAAAWCGPEGWMISNDEVAALMQAYPNRILGAASANLLAPMEAVRELRRAVKTLGFRALRLVPWLWNLPPNDRCYYPLFVECVELGIPFCTQVRHTGPLRPSETGRPIPYLDEVALDFPDLVIVAGHIGYPCARHQIRKCLHRHVCLYGPTLSAWLTRQITEAFPWDAAPRYLLRDQDTSYGICFRNRVRAMGGCGPLALRRRRYAVTA